MNCESFNSISIALHPGENPAAVYIRLVVSVLSLACVAVVFIPRAREAREGSIFSSLRRISRIVF